MPLPPRDRPMISLTLDPAEIAAADELAAAMGMTRSRLIGHLIREASLDHRLNLQRLRQEEKRRRKRDGTLR